MLIKMESPSGGGGDTVDFENVGSVSAYQKFTLGYKPKQIMAVFRATNYNCAIVYDENVSTSSYKLFYSNSTYTTSLPNTSDQGIKSVDNDGFTWGPVSNTEMQYVAIK